MAQVIALKKSEPDPAPAQMVAVDFLELDAMRICIRRALQAMKRAPRFRRGTYDYSRFYIGRYLTRFSFHGLYCASAQVPAVLAALGAEFSGENYAFIREGQTIHVYLRGADRGRKG